MIRFTPFLFALILTLNTNTLFAAEPLRPNVVVILADDIGFGDWGCYGATKIKTPNLDRLAAQGMRFTDAHSPAAVCTPTRYAMLTGQYAFRHKPGSAILSGVAPLSIPADRATVSQMMKKAGYTPASWESGIWAWVKKKRITTSRSSRVRKKWDSIILSSSRQRAIARRACSSRMARS